jgi:mRNA interferase MazF
LYADSEAKSSIYNLAIMVPLSATLQPDLARPEVVATPANGLRTNSVAVVKALRAVAVGRLSARLGTAEPGLVQAVREVVAALLDLP